MKKQTIRAQLITATFLALGACATRAAPAALTLAEGGKANCVVVVPKGTMAEDVKFPRSHNDYLERIAEIKRQLLRDSARDLAHYLGKIAGAEFEVVEARS